MKKNKGFDIRKGYRDSWNYVRESKKFIYAIIILFAVFTLIGILVPVPEALAKALIEFIKELIEMTKDMSHFELTKFIFLNNLQSSFFGMIFGVFFGIFPVMVAIVNGYVLGFVSLIVIQNEGIWSLWRLLPHGIFELAAVFISLGLGLRLSSFVFQKENNFKFLWKNLIASIKVLLFIVIPLLLLAAIIEGTLIFLF